MDNTSNFWECYDTLHAYMDSFFINKSILNTKCSYHGFVLILQLKSMWW